MSYARTSRGNKIACMFVRCSPNARYTLLHSHGNAVDLGQMSSFYMGLGSRINCNIFSYDYSGYGASSGKPSEKNLYADIDGAWNALRTQVWSLSSFKVSRQLLMNDLNQVSSVSLLVTASTAFANEGLFELT